jgi:hypothetical protein
MTFFLIKVTFIQEIKKQNRNIYISIEKINLDFSKFNFFADFLRILKKSEEEKYFSTFLLFSK